MRFLYPMVALAAAASAPARTGLPAVLPYYKYTRTIVAASECGEQNYLMVPVSLRLDAHHLLFGFKRGYSHMSDREAGFELGWLDPVTEVIEPRRINLHRPKVVFEDGEFVRFPNGDIALYLDVQKGSAAAIREGLFEYRSHDGGRTFGEVGKVSLVDGVQYGYAFEALSRHGTTWMLAMRFTNLPGGGPEVYPHHAAGSVDVISSSDNGRNWHFVRNLTREFGGYPINESSFVFAAGGFIVVTRGYDDRQRLQRTDGDFRLQERQELNTEYDCINSYVGRPRVFVRDGVYYLMGRNWSRPGKMASPLGNGQLAGRDAHAAPMDLSLFRFDPGPLTLNKHVILDNAENENVVDGYYATPYWEERGDRTYFNLITYKRSFRRTPDILRLEFDWDEIR